MSDLLKSIITITYSSCLTIALGYIVAVVKDMRKSKKEEKNTSARLESKIDNLTTIVEENQMYASRYRIIRYDDEELHGIKHSEDHRTQILEDIDVYKTYCDNHKDFKNHKGQNAMRRILNNEENKEYKEV